MKILERAIYRGPNIYSSRPMVRVRIDLEALEDHPTDRLDGFTAGLVQQLPGLRNHGCSYGAPGGFVRRMVEGTWIGHVIEHVALELQSQAGSPVTRGKTRSVRGRPGVYDVMYRYESEAAALLAGRCAAELVCGLLPEDLRGCTGLDLIAPAHPGDGVEAMVAAIGALVRKDRLGPTTQSLVNEARRRGIPVARVDDRSLIRLGQGARQKLIRASITANTSHVAVETAGNKSMTKAVLEAAGCPTPRGAVVRTAEAAAQAAARIGAVVVTKPLNGNHGRGVSLGLSTPEQVHWGFAQAAAHDTRAGAPRVIVEEQYVGRDYRVLVVDGKIVAVAERKPAHVVGDGTSTVAQLIEAVNRDPRRGAGHEKVMTRITVDAHVEEMLARQGRDVNSVPPAGTTVMLRATGNMSTGGTAIDRTDEIHPANAMIAIRAARAVGLDVAGIDFMAPDIATSVRQTGGGIVEVNAAPGFRMHLEPSEGQPRDVAKAVIASLYPPGSRSRIPVVAITGTNGKSTVGRMTAAMFKAQGMVVGLTNTSGVYVDGELIRSSDASGPKSARAVLADPMVEAAVLETARGGILREGLGFDRCDVGAVLNVAEDHMGLGGIDTLDDLARVKSVVTEAVRRGGVSVLNGDDPLTLRIAKWAGGAITYFTMTGGDEMSPHLQKHCAGGGVVVCAEGEGPRAQLVILEGLTRTPVITAGEIPATLDGAAAFNVRNALAAIAIGRGAGIAVETLRTALAGFASSYEENPGRLNVHDGHGFRVILDYAHNPAAMAAFGEMIARLRPRYDRLIGVVSIPGDRRDEDILEMGRLGALIFDQLVFRERPDGRGRAPGGVLSLLLEGARQAGKDEARIATILNEPGAIDMALRMAGPADLVAVFPTGVEAAWAQVMAFRADTAAPRRRRKVAADQADTHV